MRLNTHLWKYCIISITMMWAPKINSNQLESWCANSVFINLTKPSTSKNGVSVNSSNIVELKIAAYRLRQAGRCRVAERRLGRCDRHARRRLWRAPGPAAPLLENCCTPPSASQCVCGEPSDQPRPRTDCTHSWSHLTTDVFVYNSASFIKLKVPER